MFFNLIDMLTNDSSFKPFEVPKSIPDYVKPFYHYFKLCGNKPFISIVGSYSAGKSSFLNTLLNKDIALSDTSKTTSIPMFVKNDRPNILLKTPSSKIINLEVDYLESIMNQVSHDSCIDFRKYIDFLVLSYDKFPYKDIILVDTPGYSGGDDDYGICKTMIDISDSILFTFDASRGDLTHEDLEIIKYAKEKKSEIFIIANKIDKIWESRDELLEHIRNSLAKRKININKTNICYFSSDFDFEKERASKLYIIQKFIKKTASKKDSKLSSLIKPYLLGT